MKNFKADFLKIYRSERGLLIIMIFNLLLSIALCILALIKLNPNSAVVKIGYGDIGGYRDGTWVDMLAFPLLAMIFGIFHNLLTVKIFHKRGSGMAKFFLLITTVLILGTFLVLIRLLGES
ncbi:hypothetical protein IJG89_03185 [Candidatus Saccharibacteria bacterium]|nr:hypothetical protein [Candidatus Saccharibacteria bacterium]